jgi:hypothetical protein
MSFDPPIFWPMRDGVDEEEEEDDEWQRNEGPALDVFGGRRCGGGGDKVKAIGILSQFAQKSEVPSHTYLILFFFF